MLRALFAALMLFFAIPAAGAQAPTEGDYGEIRRVISEQIAAFRSDDGAKAYSFAAPSIRRIFPTSEIFMAMVRQGYRPVYRPQSFKFGQAGLDDAGRPTQRLTIIGPDGKTYEALYALERQPDGSWKIDGCTILEVPGLDA